MIKFSKCSSKCGGSLSLLAYQPSVRDRKEAEGATESFVQCP